MTVCALCPEFIAEACGNREMMVKVLMKFPDENEFKVALDDGNKIFDLCQLIALKRSNMHLQRLAVWMDLLLSASHISLERIAYSNRTKDHKIFAVGMATRIKSDAVFILWSREGYLDRLIRRLKIPIYDRNEAISLFNRSGKRKNGETSYDLDEDEPKGDRRMIDIATAGIVIKAIADSVGVVDKIYAGYRSLRGKEGVNAIAADDGGTVLKEVANGQVIKEVTREELSKILQSSDIQYIKSYEREVNVQYQVWLEARKEQNLATGGQKAIYGAQADEAAERIGQGLDKLNAFMKRVGIALPNEYLALKEVAKK